MTYDVSHLYIFLIEVSFKICCSFLKLLSFLSYFGYIHFIRCIIFSVFSQSLAYPFILLLVSFAELKFLNLWSSTYQFFFFHQLCFCIAPENSSAYQSHLDFLLCYFLGILYFCILHFRSMIKFELIFVKSVRSVSKFILN